MAYIRKAFLDLGIVNIDNNEILENEISLGRWIADATLLLFSKGESCNFQKRLLINKSSVAFIPDFYFERGIKALGLQGRTIIQLKENLLLESEISQTNLYENLLKEKLVDKILLVYIHSGLKINVENTYKGLFQIEEGNAFIDRVKEAINEGKGQIISELTKKVQPKTWVETRDDRLAKAINDYTRYDSVLFIGAGVSVSANLPNWKMLLKELMLNEDVIKIDDFDDIYNEMDYSNLMLARYIQKAQNRSESKYLVEKLRSLFYPNKKQSDSKLVNEIVQMIICERKVRSVITYNYDTILENAIRQKGKRCFSVYRNNRDEYNSFPIYHVHGVVFPEVKSDQIEEIILSEEDYHRVYTEVFDWSNVEQLHALTRCTCFFIGLSMKDPNLRRLLEIAKRYSGNAVRHYVFLERKSFTDDIKKSEVDFQIRENIMADLGLNVIWYKGNDNHKELPELLKQFHEK